MGDDDDDVPQEIREYFRRFGKYGKQGGEARAAKLTPAQRRKIARLAGQASAKARRKKRDEQQR